MWNPKNKVDGIDDGKVHTIYDSKDAGKDGGKGGVQGEKIDSKLSKLEMQRYWSDTYF